MSSGAGEAGLAGGLDLNCDTAAVLDNHEAGVEEGLEDELVSTKGEVFERERGDTMEAGGDVKKECERGVDDWENGMVGNGKGSDGSEFAGGSEDGVVGTVRREAGIESHGGKLLEVDLGEKGSTELVSVSTVGFEDVEASSQAMDLGHGYGSDQKRGTDVDTEGVVGSDEGSPTVLLGGEGDEDESLEGSSILRREHIEVRRDLGDESGQVVDGELGTGKWEAETKSHGRRCMEVDMREKRSAKLVGASAELPEAIVARSHGMDLGDGSEGGQKRGADVNTEGMVGTYEVTLSVLVGGRGADDERLERSSILRREQVEVQVNFVDGGGGIVDGREESEIEGESHGAKLLEMDTREKETADLATVSAEEFAAVGASNKAVNSGDDSGGDQKQGIDINAEDMVIDGQFCLGEREAELVPHSGKFLEVEKGEKGSAELVAVSTEGFEPVEASSHDVTLHEGSGGDEKRRTHLDAKLDLGDNGTAELVAISTVGFEGVQASSQATELGDGSGGDQKPDTGENTESVVGTNEDSIPVIVGGTGAEGERLEGSSIVREEHVEVDLMDGGVQVIDGQLGPEERKTKVKYHGMKFLEVDTGGRESTDLFAVSTEEFDVVEASNQTVNLGIVSGDDQKQGFDVDVEGIVIDGQLGLVERDAEVKSHSEKFLEVDKGDEGSAELAAVSSEGFQPVEASSHSMDFHDESVGDQKRGTDVDTKGMVGTDEGYLAVLFGGGGPEGERLEGSLILTEQAEVQVDLVDGSDPPVDGELGPGERKAEVDSHEGMLLEVDMGEKESADLVAVSAEEFEVANKQAMNSGDCSGGDQIQGIDVDAEGIVIDGQLSPGERVVEVKSHSSKLLEADKREKVSAELVAVSTEIFEPVEASSQLMDFGDGSDGDQKRGIGVNAEGVAIDSELSPGKREVEVEPHGRKFLEVVKGDNGSAELPAVLVEGFVPVKASSQAMDLVDGSGGDQWLETDVDAEAMVRTDKDSVVTSVASGTPEDARLEGSLVLRKENVEVQGNLVDGSGDFVDGELGIAKGEVEVKSYGERCMEVDMGEKGSAMLVATSAQRSDAVEASSHAMDLGDGLDCDAEGMVGNEDSVTVSVVVDAPENERLVGSMTLGNEQVDVMVHLVDGFGQVVDSGMVSREMENELEPHGGNLLEVELEEEKKELIAVSAERFGAVEVSCPAMDLGQRSGDDQTQGIDVSAEGMVDTGDDSAAVSAGRGVCEDERLEESPVLGIEHVDVLKKSVDGCGQVADSELIHGERKPVVESHGGKLLEVESGAKAGAELFAISAEEGFEIVEACSHEMELENGSGSDQKQEDIGLRAFQGAVLEMMGGKTGIGLHSTVGSEQVGVLTQASSVENDQKTCDENSTVAGETSQRQDSLPIAEEQDSGLHQMDGDMKNTVSGMTICCDVARTGMTLDAAVNTEACSDEHTAVDNMVEKGHVLEDNGSVTSVTSAELQNGDPLLNFDYTNQKKDSSSLMVSCREEAHTAGPHSLGNFFVEKGSSIMEDSNSILGISTSESSVVNGNLIVTPQWNEPSSGCQHVQSPNVPSREHEEIEPEQGNSAFESALRAVDEAIDCSQSLQDGRHEHLKESESQSEECDNTRTESSSTSRQATYYLSFPEKEGFSTSDLVWGKVKSHPWWPGQIFDFSGASELALKYQKKDCFLVAYFGDKTFAWCEESRLKPFQLYFSQMEKQTSSDSFLRAVHDILVEISRRVELAMTCLCIPEETRTDIKYQKVENAGVRGKTVSSFIDRYEVVNYFHPDKLLQYIRALGQLPTGGADRLELTIAVAQLKAFYLSKGYTELPALTIGSGLVENDFEIPSSMNKNMNEVDLEHSATLSDLFSAKGKLRGRDGALGKQKHIVEDGRKQKSLSELMQEETTFLLVNECENTSEVNDDEGCVSSGNKRKAIDYVSTDIGRSNTKKINSQADKETKLPSPTSNSSFKVGEFISRAASKLTSGQPIRKCHGEISERFPSKTDDMSIDYMNIDEFLDVPFDYPKLRIDISEDYPPTNEMLSKLCLAARNPMKGYNFSSIVVSFFSAFRNVLVSNFSIEMNKIEKPRSKRGRKKKIISDLELLDTSTPDHMKDSYWSDMILPEKDVILNPPKRRGRKKRKFTDESSLLQMLNFPSDCEQKLHIGTMCPHVKHILTAERPIISVEEKIVDERTPTAVILNFNCSNSLPSDMDLIRIFSRYGPLKEEETYIERKNNSAMVVFKKRADAEMAFSSAGKFSTFGPALLSYRLRHFSSKSSPVNTLKSEEDVQPIKDLNLGILSEPGSKVAFDEKLCEAGEESSIFVQSQGHLEPALDMSPVPFEDVNKGQSYFVQTQEDTGNTHVEIGGEFSELVQCQVGDVVVSNSIQANTAWKEPSEDVPVQMVSFEGSDHLLLESLNQELSYFDIDSGNVQVETIYQDSSGSVVGLVKAGVISDMSVTEVGGEKSSGILLDKAETEVSHTANVRSLDQQLCDPASVLVKAITGVESTIQVAVTGVESVADQELSGPAPPAERKDIPDQPGETEYSCSPPALVGTGTSNESLVTSDVQSMETERANFVQDNEVIGVDSCAMEIQAMAEGPYNSIAAQREITTSKESFEMEIISGTTHVEGKNKESFDSDLVEAKTSNLC